MVGKIIMIIHNFTVGTSKNETIDHRGVSTQVTYETDHISLLRRSQQQVH